MGCKVKGTEETTLYRRHLRGLWPKELSEHPRDRQAARTLTRGAKTDQEAPEKRERVC